MPQENKPAFLRPVEIRSGVNDTIDITQSGSSTRTITINAGTYSSMPAVLEAFNTAANASALFSSDGVTTTMSVTHGQGLTGLLWNTLYVRIQFAGVTPECALDFKNTVTSQMLGFAATTASASADHFSNYRAEYCWTPAFQTAVQSRFQVDQKGIFGGFRVKSGGLAGIQTGPKIYHLDCAFFNEEAQNLVVEAVEVDDDLTKPAEYFFTESMTAGPAVSGNARMNGFFYYHNINNAVDSSDRINVIPGGTTGIDWTYEGIQFDYDSNEDRYAWCALDPNGYAQAKPSTPSGRTYWQIEFRINTDTSLPTFKAPDQT